MNKQNTSTLVIAVLLIVLAAMSRVIMYPFNYSSILAMAIFSGAIIKDKRLAFAMPLVAMFLADVMFEFFTTAPGFWGWGQLVGYGILALITFIAFSMKKINVLTVAGYSVGSSLLFFFLSNSAFFVFDNPIYHLYPANFNGYIQSLIAGIPFLGKGVIVDLVYSAVLFGTYYLVKNYALTKKAIA
ncbi:MAG TPA: DUF6580 family putative transport protein [Ferruginibacter sp.]|nr:DUF6580 family putative transport protein [Ferruginibacter sp.]